MRPLPLLLLLPLPMYSKIKSFKLLPRLARCSVECNFSNIHSEHMLQPVNSQRGQHRVPATFYNVTACIVLHMMTNRLIPTALCLIEVDWMELTFYVAAVVVPIFVCSAIFVRWRPLDQNQKFEFIVIRTIFNCFLFYEHKMVCRIKFVFLLKAFR